MLSLFRSFACLRLKLPTPYHAWPHIPFRSIDSKSSQPTSATATEYDDDRWQQRRCIDFSIINEKYMDIGKSSFCFIVFRASPETFSHIQTNEQKIKEIKWKRND